MKMIVTKGSKKYPVDALFHQACIIDCIKNPEEFHANPSLESLRRKIGKAMRQMMAQQVGKHNG